MLDNPHCSRGQLKTSWELIIDSTLKTLFGNLSHQSNFMFYMSFMVEWEKPNRIKKLTPSQGNRSWGSGFVAADSRRKRCFKKLVLLHNTRAPILTNLDQEVVCLNSKTTYAAMLCTNIWARLLLKWEGKCLVHAWKGWKTNYGGKKHTFVGRLITGSTGTSRCHPYAKCNKHF